MNEFKFACPWCRQHMMCDMSQRGSEMQCPTCFQKVRAPMAPSPDAKYILSGTKIQDKKAAAKDDAAGAGEGKKFPVGILIGVIVLVLGAGAAVYFLHGRASKPDENNSSKPVAAATNPPPVEPEPAPQPQVVATPANDTNWTLNLSAVVAPKTPVAGRIHGQDFSIERAYFQNGTLTLRAGTQGAMEFGALITFGNAQPEAMVRKTINVNPDAEKAAPVQLRWKDDSGVQRKQFNSGYALRLEFGALVNSRLYGKIYLCTPDPEKSYLMGTFNADAHKPKPKPPAPAPAK